MSGTILITGTTSGFGQAMARLFVQNGWKVIGTGRRADRLEKLKTDLGEAFHALVFDIMDEAATTAALAGLPEDFQEIDILVNNAGLALGTASAPATKLSDRKTMIDTNITGLVTITDKLLPKLIERKGMVVNISSIAGQFVTPGAGWYGASKFAVEAISDALRMELQSFGVKVVLIEPGLIRTGFEAVSQPSFETGGDDPVWGSMMRSVARAWAEGFRQGSDPDVVAACIERALTVSDPEPRYRCGSSSESALIQRFIPTRLWDAIIRRQMIGR